MTLYSDNSELNFHAQVTPNFRPYPTMATTPEPSTPKKLSGAELKAQKKAEKAAARAKQKGDGPADAPSKGQPPKPEQQSSKPQKGRPTGPSKDASDSRPQKSQQPSGTKQPAVVERPKSSEPAGETPVAVFAHLYDKPKRHTIPGASKDVHPAIQALGLQYSTYEVCGSTARCIAMLLALKPVFCHYHTILDYI